MNQSKASASVYLIGLLILVRILLGQSQEIIYINYAINCVSFFYVIIQVLRKAYSEVKCDVDEHGFNVIINNDNRGIKKIFARITVLIAIILIVAGLCLYFFGISETYVGMINDVIALAALLLSIEDDSLCARIIMRYKL